MDYATTEGYVPVTLTAQESEAYQDYLSRAGQDNDMYYDVKIAASELLLDRAQDTFITPVFNGSTALRNAAGQLIEDVTKSVRRNETVDDAYMKNLYSEVAALYHLDESGTPSGQEADLGPLPPMARGLLITLGAVWVLIILYLIVSKTSAVKKTPKDSGHR